MKIITKKRMQGILENEWIRGYEAGVHDLSTEIRIGLPQVIEHEQAVEVMGLVKEIRNEIINSAERQVSK